MSNERGSRNWAKLNFKPGEYHSNKIVNEEFSRIQDNCDELPLLFTVEGKLTPGMFKLMLLRIDDVYDHKVHNHHVHFAISDLLGSMEHVLIETIDPEKILTSNDDFEKTTTYLSWNVWDCCVDYFHGIANGHFTIDINLCLAFLKFRGEIKKSIFVDSRKR